MARGICTAHTVSYLHHCQKVKKIYIIPFTNKKALTNRKALTHCLWTMNWKWSVTLSDWLRQLMISAPPHHRRAATGTTLVWDRDPLDSNSFCYDCLCVCVFWCRINRTLSDSN